MTAKAILTGTLGGSLAQMRKHLKTIRLEIKMDLNEVFSRFCKRVQASRPAFQSIAEICSNFD